MSKKINSQLWNLKVPLSSKTLLDVELQSVEGSGSQRTNSTSSPWQFWTNLSVVGIKHCRFLDLYLEQSKHSVHELHCPQRLSEIEIFQIKFVKMLKLNLKCSHQVSISPMFYEQLLLEQIQKCKKYSQAVSLFCAFGIFVPKSFE